MFDDKNWWKVGEERSRNPFHVIWKWEKNQRLMKMAWKLGEKDELWKIVRNRIDFWII